MLTVTTWLALPAFAVALGLSRLLSSGRFGPAVLDRPGERSLHDRPMPRTGGLALWAGLVATVPFVLVATGVPPGFFFLAGGAVLVGGFSLWDDLRPLSQLFRFFAQVAAALLLNIGGFAFTGLSIPALGWLPLGVMGQLVTLMGIVWLTNLYNFMDGMDGFAGGIGAWGFFCLAVLGWMEGHDAFAQLAILIAAANFGFLWLNFPPARIFLGDVGSIPMGFLVAGFALWGVRDGIFPLWVPGLIFSPFVVDATITVARRALRREKVWLAHRTHYYQRLVLLGWGHRKTVLAEYLLMMGTGGSALGLHRFGNDALSLVVLIAWASVYIGLAVLIGRLERQPRASAP